MNYLLRVYNIIHYFKGYIWKVLLVSVLGVIVSILMLYQPQYIGNILTNYSNISQKTVAYFLILTISLLVTSSVKFYIAKSIAEGVAYNIRKKVFGKLLYTSLESVSEEKSGSIISVLSNDINLLRDSIGADFFDVIGAVILLFGSIYFLITINYKLFIYTLILFILIILLSFIGSSILKKVVLEQQESLSHFIEFVENFLKNMVLIKVFWLVDKSQESFEKSSKKIYTTGLKNSKIKSIIMSVNNLIFQFGIIIIVLLAGIDVNNNVMSLSDLAQFVLYSSFLVTPISIIANTLVSINIILAAEERIFKAYDLLDFSEKTDTKKGIFLEDKEYSVKIEKINFFYREKCIFRNFSANFCKNKVNLIVGESGVGKTTLARLMVKLYTINSGKIFIKGIDVDNYSVEYLRTKMISYIPQEVVEWGDTIYESITLGKDYKIEYINYLLTRLNLRECIDSLEEGLNSKIGTIMSKLSSGEMQRLSILRGIMRESEILILDEPTANLDTENEIIVNNFLKELSNEKTVILISHKESSRSIADNIVEIGRGCVKC
ncbi:ABC transporter ATP-binding protein [Gemella cuniculi]|uniref:ABC transporter ATP-binding protein n=1 Tax=Gemella cuniculi TaxID=150240 RepID=UPI000417EE53|nr:ABC transporter ATP-binding protein [Gemella cuniculi]